MAAATLLLPARQRFAGQALPDAVARAIARADPVAGEPGREPQLARHFALLPARWPVAALTRQRDAGDALHSAWLRADPAWVRPDINGARLFGWGDALQLDRADCEALLPALRPLFGDAGFPIDAPVTGRWYLRLPRDVRLPEFASPEAGFGEDLFGHLPGGPEGRRWRALFSEAQVVLHNHPRNAERIAAGKPPVNSLWFWGGGVLPDHVRTRYAAVHSGDALVAALADAAGATAETLPEAFAMEGQADVLHDLHASRDFRALVDAWLAPAIRSVRDGTLACLQLDFEDGTGLRIERRQRMRFWRRRPPVPA